MHKVVKLMEEAIAKKKAERMEVVEKANIANSAAGSNSSWQEKVNRRTSEVTMEVEIIDTTDASTATSNSSTSWKTRLNKRKDSEVDIEAKNKLKR